MAKDEPKLDYDYIGKLLTVAEKTRGYPTLKPIHDRVMHDLEQESCKLVPGPTLPRVPAVAPLP